VLSAHGTGTPILGTVLAVTAGGTRFTDAVRVALAPHHLRFTTGMGTVARQDADTHTQNSQHNRERSHHGSIIP